MAVKIPANLRYPEVVLPSSSFSFQRKLNANSKAGKFSMIKAIQSQEEAAAAPTSTRYQATRMRRPQNIEGESSLIGEMSSAVFKQPTSEEERLKALQESYKKLVDACGLAASFGCPLGCGGGTPFMMEEEMQKIAKMDSSEGGL